MATLISDTTPLCKQWLHLNRQEEDLLKRNSAFPDVNNVSR